MNKSADRQFDLTQGGILNKLLMVALPIMGTQLMQMAYNLTDMFWLGRVSSDMVAASGTAGMYIWLSTAFIFIGRMGAEIGIAQCMGKGDTEAAQKYSQNALFLSVVLGLCFTVVMMVFAGPLIDFFAIKEAAVAAGAQSYLFLVSISMPATFISAAVTGTFNGSGNSWVPFLINALGLVLNIILDPVLIFTFNMGIEGAAIATVVAQAVVVVLSLWVMVWKRTRPFQNYRFFTKPDGALVRQILKWSTPIGLESMLFTLLSMIISRFVADWGASAIAVQRVGSQVESLSWMIGGGFASAITAFVGQNFGAGKWARIRSGFCISLMTISIWGLFVMVLLLVAGGALFSIFLPDPKLVGMGATYLRILAVCQIFVALESAAGGAFRGMGKTLPPSVASIACNAMRVLLAYFLSQTSLGLDGLWWGIALGASLRGAWIFIWFLVVFRCQPRDDIQPT